MSTVDVLVVVTIVAVLAFDVTNGFHDTANVVATGIASGALTPRTALVIVVVFNFLGPLVLGTAVAETVGSVVRLDGLSPTAGVQVVLAGVLGAIAWNVGTWLVGMPSSSSHALVGGLVGAALAASGASAVRWGVADLADGELTGLAKIGLSLVLSPVLGLLAGLVLHRVGALLLRGARPGANRVLRRLQLGSCAWLAFSHGGNDAQKSMGVIALLLVLSGHRDALVVPTWAVLVCATAIALGSASGGWRIVRTLGFRVYHVRPQHALEAQAAAAAVVQAAAMAGGPVSTTHVTSMAIVGVGAGDRPRSVRWDVGAEMVATWLVTVPCAAAAGALALGAVRIVALVV